MKNTFICLTLVFVLLFAVSLPAIAETEGGQTISLTVTEAPSPTWTLEIPANQEIEENAVVTTLNTATVTDIAHLADGQSIDVYFDYTSLFVNSEDPDITIPFSIKKDGNGEIPCGENYVYANYTNSGETMNEAFTINISAEAWASAEIGEYSTIITYGSAIHE